MNEKIIKGAEGIVFKFFKESGLRMGKK